MEKGKEHPSHIIFILTDVRTLKELEFFEKKRKNFQIFLKIRIESNEECRKKRGWVPSDVDKLFTEVELDSVKDWDCLVRNEEKEEETISQIEKIIDDMVSSMK